MRTLRSSSAFDLLDRLEQQLSQQLPNTERVPSERVPAAELHETTEAYVVLVELPGVDGDAIDVKATDRNREIRAERRRARNLPADAETKPPLMSEFHYGTWSRGFRFPQVIRRDQLQARYRDGLLTVTAPKADTVTAVSVTVDG
jgi:HSP20 family protein